MGSDSASSISKTAAGYFNPRSPRGERLSGFSVIHDKVLFQSTLPAWGATPSLLAYLRDRIISIHAPRVGSDGLLHPRYLLIVNFNPRSPRGERPLLMPSARRPPQISIHAPRVGSDVRTLQNRHQSPDFNPRSPRGERLVVDDCGKAFDDISIHAPRVGSDKPSLHVVSCKWIISIHAPRVGSDDVDRAQMRHLKQFQSTLPAWGATMMQAAQLGVEPFQSTLPAWGATCGLVCGINNPRFQSTLPAWGATMALSAFESRLVFQSTLPAWGATSR